MCLAESCAVKDVELYTIICVTMQHCDCSWSTAIQRSWVNNPVMELPWCFTYRMQLLTLTSNHFLARIYNHMNCTVYQGLQHKHGCKLSPEIVDVIFLCSIELGLALCKTESSQFSANRN
jgi:hypothetical protein